MMKSPIHFKRYSLSTLAGAFLVSGCMATLPPKQLVDARAAYQEAAEGPAGKLTPAELVDAKKALTEAERSFEKDGASPETLDAAYLAQRRAQTAHARGGLAQAEADEQKAKEELAEARAGTLRATESELAASRGEATRSGQRLAVAEQALVSETQRRREAEARVKAAMDRLALAASLAVKEEPRGTVITLPGNVLFATAAWQLLPGPKTQLDAVAMALKDQPDVTITIEGHTDSQGTDESNVELSQKRAESVRGYLVSKGIPTAHVVASGIGEARPIGDNGTTDGRAQNRRVEIVVTPIEAR